jgi:hypothetical protein
MPHTLIYNRFRALARFVATRSAGMLLAVAGVLVITGAQLGSKQWADLQGVGLGLLLAAALIAVVACVRIPTERPVTASHTSRRGWMILGVMVLFHVGMALYLARLFPGATIDCFTFQRDAAATLVHGANPYGGTQLDIYSPELSQRFYGAGVVIGDRVQVGLQYPPLTLLWVVPGYLLGDIRYSYIAAVLLVAWLTVAICPGVRGLCFAGFLLLTPLPYYVENRCFTEPMVLLALSATLYAAVKKRWWLPIALGLFLASKQYNFLALPFVGCLVVPFAWKAYAKLLGGAVLVAVATVLPFVPGHEGALWHDLVLFHLKQPFRQDALSFAVTLPWLQVVGPLLVVGFVVWALCFRVQRPAMFAAGYGIALLLFVVTSKQAFDNYFFLIGQALLLGAAALYRDGRAMRPDAAEYEAPVPGTKAGIESALECLGCSPDLSGRNSNGNVI